MNGDKPRADGDPRPARRPGRRLRTTLYRQFLIGAAYALGSAVVSVLVYVAQHYA